MRTKIIRKEKKFRKKSALNNMKKRERKKESVYSPQPKPYVKVNSINTHKS